MSKQVTRKGVSIPIPETEAEYRRYFADLPDECVRDYELALTDCASHSTSGDVDILRGIVGAYNARTDADAAEEAIAYAAFYTLHIIYRAWFDSAELDKLTSACRRWVSKHDSFVHLETLRCLQTGEFSDEMPEKLLERDYAFAQEHRDNAGFCHAFCDLYATLCDRDEAHAPDLRQTWEKRALREIDRIIALDPNYAKFYCTRGRILAVSQSYDEAERMIQEAVNREDSSRADYALRVNSYQITRLRIHARRLIEDAKRQLNVEAIRSEIGELKHATVSTIEIVGFFSGIVSFVLGSLSLAQGQSATHAALLIITLMGCLMSVYAVFVALLRVGDSDHLSGAHIKVAVIGGLIAAASALLTLRI